MSDLKLALLQRSSFTLLCKSKTNVNLTILVIIKLLNSTTVLKLLHFQPVTSKQICWKAERQHCTGCGYWGEPASEDIHGQ